MPSSACPPDHKPCRNVPVHAIPCEIRLPTDSLHVRQGLRAAEPLDQGPALLHRQLLKPCHIARQTIDELGELLPEQREDHHQGDDKQEHEKDQDDEAGAEAPEANPLQPVSQWVEHVGERKACDERQQDGAENGEQKHRDGKSHEPENHLPLERHRLITSDCPPRDLFCTATRPEIGTRRFDGQGAEAAGPSPRSALPLDNPGTRLRRLKTTIIQLSLARGRHFPLPRDRGRLTPRRNTG